LDKRSFEVLKGWDTSEVECLSSRTHERHLGEQVDQLFHSIRLTRAAGKSELSGNRTRNLVVCSRSVIMYHQDKLVVF
jgi:hypothetical protein